MAELKDRVEKAKKRVLTIIDKMDPSGENRKIYESMFSGMTDKDFVKFCKTGVIRVYSAAYDHEPKYKDLLDTAKFMGIPISERLTYPALYNKSDLVGPNPGEPGYVKDELIVDKDVMVIPITFRRLQQIIAKENSVATEISSRDKTNQVIGDDKAAMMSDMEVAMLVSRGADKILTEMLTFRSDHDISKSEAYANLINTGETNIPDSISDIEGRNSLQMLYWYYIGMGLDTDLLGDSIK